MDMLSGSQCLTNDLSPLAKLFSKTQLCYCDSFKVLIFVISMAILEISTIIAMNNWKNVKYFLSFHSVV